MSAEHPHRVRSVTTNVYYQLILHNMAKIINKFFKVNHYIICRYFCSAKNTLIRGAWFKTLWKHEKIVRKRMTNTNIKYNMSTDRTENVGLIKW